MNPQDTKVIVGMSGGVDSSVAALLLCEQGYQVSGLFMKNWDEDDGTEYCTALTDLADAESVCKQLDIKLHTANFAAEYWDNVFDHFLDEYRRGRTPNPDILCNKEIKFKAFLDYATQLGADCIATGHYARTVEVEGHTHLYKGLDPLKDQSYFLSAVQEKQLERTLFPIGALPKPEVRALAAQYSLSTHNKKDSTGICFIGEQPFRAFLARFLPAQTGVIKTLNEQAVGEHPGVIYYTLGQREGLRIGGVRGAVEGPWFVVAKDVANNVLYVAQGHDHPALLTQRLLADGVTWIAGVPPALPLRCAAKTRYRQPDQACVIETLVEGRASVVFDRPQRAVTPGQSVVFYQGDICLGGGVIDATF